MKTPLPPPEHQDPELSLGTLFNYSGLIGKLVEAFTQLSGAQVGEAVTLPEINSWLPIGGEWVLQVVATRKK